MVSPASPTASLPDHVGNTMFRRTRNRKAEHATTATDDVVEGLVRPTHSSSKNKNNSGKEPFNLKAFFRGHASVGSKVTSKNRGVQFQSKRGRPGMLRKSTSSHFTRSTTLGRSSAFSHKSSTFMVEPLTTSGFLVPEELADFENNDRRHEEEEEAKEEITADYNDADGHGHAPLQLLDEDIYGDPLVTTADPDALHQTDMNGPLHMAPKQRLPPPETYFAMKKNENEELGRIQFEVDTMTEAQAEATRRQMPILCIEAEIPGDVTTGETIFSHPLIVEAAESLFVTVLQKPLQPQDDDDDGCRRGNRFFTNSSCRTRVRILDDCAIDVLPPVEQMSAALVVAAMVRGLESYRMRVPLYLRLLLEEESGKLQVLSKTRFRDIQGKAVFGMYDAAMAEVEFAGLDGVLATRSGSLVRQHVVQVTYDSRRLSYSALVRHALRRTGANMIYYETNDQRIAAQLEVQQFESFRQTLQQRFVDGQGGEPFPFSSIKITEGFGNLRASNNPKPALRDSILKFVPMTELQATRANRFIHLNRFDEAMHLLSPRQGLIAMESLRQHHTKSFHFHDVVDVPIHAAWKELCGEDTDPTEHDDSERCHYCCLVPEEQTEFLTDDEDEADELYQ